jgi:hypothetical protein
MFYLVRAGNEYVADAKRGVSYAAAGIGECQQDQIRATR